MANGIVGIDHVLVGVDDLETSKAAWTRLGFTLTPRGRHAGRSSGNYCIMFPDDYVELLGIVDSRLPDAANIVALREQGEGLLAVALATDSAEATHAGFAAADLEPPDIADLSREIELPEGKAETRFRLVQLPPERTPGFRLFVCDHLTPGETRRPAWLNHANGAVRLRSATVTVDRPEDLIPAYSSIFGAGSLAVTNEMVTVFIGNHRLLLVTLADLPRLFPDWEVPRELSPPRGVSVSFAVGDLDRTAEYLESAGVTFDEPAAGYLHVSPSEANNVLIEFSAA